MSTQRPDLSGSWAATKDAPPSLSAAPSPILGQQVTLDHKGDTLTLMRPIRDEVIKMTLKLDGGKTGFRVPGALCQGDGEAFETAVWEDGGITMTTVGTAPPGGGPARPLDVKRTLRLQDPDTLIVQGTLNKGGQAVPVGTVYKKSTTPLPAPKTAPVKGTPATIAQVAWIGAVWSGTTKTTTTEERWTPPSAGAMLAVARTLRDNLMVSFEFLCIAERGGSLVYTAMPNGRTPPTDFFLTAVTADSATFENPAYDYPKMVRYTRRPDGALETTIAAENGQRSVSVVLERRE